SNQRSYASAGEAARFLGVKLATLYAYASRGLVQSIAGPGGRRGRQYAVADLARLKARHAARAGHAAVAGRATRCGAPVPESASTSIGAEGPVYRGHAAVALAEAGTSFEQVAELLWSGQLPERAQVPEAPRLPARFPSVPPGAPRIVALSAAVATFA